jgi:hypothetical protein
MLGMDPQAAPRDATPPDAAQPAAAQPDAASFIVEEAAKKAAIAWLAVPGGGAAYPVWCLWAGGALHVVSGAGEQGAPGLAEATTVQVTLRGDHGGRVVTWPATVTRLTPDMETWAEVVPQLAGKRLNAPGTAEETAQRWAAECVVSRLTPADSPKEAGSTLPDGSHAAPPRPTPATRRPRRPFRLHRVRGSKR